MYSKKMLTNFATKEVIRVRRPTSLKNNYKKLIIRNFLQEVKLKPLQSSPLICPSNTNEVILLPVVFDELSLDPEEETFVSIYPE